MHPETRSGITVDRCERCHGIWFDAKELDRHLVDIQVPEAPGPVEAAIPSRGVGSRPCPRCVDAMHTAGWTGLVLDRCGTCRGVFVEAIELERLCAALLPLDEGTFEGRFAAFMVEGGWSILGIAGLAQLLLRFAR
jgi:Zn-finger nucleic acid-binding protein